MPKALVVGSGAGGSIVAMVLAEAGWDVVIFEKGPNYYSNLAGNGPFPTVHSNDELKSIARYFEQPDPIAFPRTFRKNAGQNAANTYVGDVNDLANQVGGTFPHSDTKCTRMWDIDFKGLSLLGPVPGADMADWPFEYSDIAPVLRRTRDADRRPGRRRVDTRERPEAPTATKALSDAARGANALVHAARRGGPARRAAPLLLPDGGQHGQLQRQPGVQQLRVLLRVRVPGLGQAGQPHRVAAGAADRAHGPAPAHPGAASPVHRPASHRRLLHRRAGPARRGERRRGGAGLLGHLVAASGAAVRAARPLRPHRHPDHVPELLRRVRRLPQPARARLQGPRLHAGRLRLQRGRLPRLARRRPTGRAALPARRPVRAWREASSRSRKPTTTSRSSGSCPACSFSAARSRS